MIPAAPLALQPVRWQDQWRDGVRDPAELLSLLGLDALATRLSPAAMETIAHRCAKCWTQWVPEPAPEPGPTYEDSDFR